MRKEYLLIIAAIIFLMALFYWQDNYLGADNMKPSVVTPHMEETSAGAAAPQESFTASTVATGDTTAIASSQLSPEVRKNFARALKEMGQCLELKNSAEDDQVDPTLDNLLNSLRPTLGEMTVLTDDWTQVDIQSADGISKRIRTEINYDHPGNPTRYLQVYKLNEDKIPEIEDTDPQQSTNPSDEYIESLKTGSNVLLSEKGGRVYFQGGEEMAVIEQNGHLDSFTMTRNNKTINCSSMVSGASSCQCY